MRTKPRHIWHMISFLIMLLGTSLCTAGDPPKKEDLRYDGKPFEYWRQYLRTELKAERRMDAIRAMGEFGARGYGRQAAPVLVKAARKLKLDAVREGLFHETDREWKFSLSAKVTVALKQALETIGPEAAPSLLANLEDPRVFKLANDLLAESGNISIDAVPTLIKLAQTKTKKFDRSPFHKEQQELAVCILGAAVKKHKNIADRVQKMVAADAQGDSFIRALIANVEHGYQAKADTIVLLGLLGRRAKAAIPALVVAKLTYEKENRQPTVDALQAMRATTDEQLPGLIKALDSMWDSTRGEAATELAKVGAKAKIAIPALLKSIKTMHLSETYYPKKRYQVQVAILASLEKLGADKKVRADAVYHTLKITTDPARKKTLLNKLLGFEKDPQTTPAKLIALLRLTLPNKEGYFESEYNGSSSGGVYLTHYLVVTPYHIQLIQALHDFGMPAKVAVPSLIEAYQKYGKNLDNLRKPEKDAVTLLRVSILDVFGNIGPEAKAAIPLLRQEATSKHLALRRAAESALRRVMARTQK